MAWATGISVASYIRLDRGLIRNPPIGWLVNAAIVLGQDLDDLLEDWMRGWHTFNRRDPPPAEWRERDEVIERAERWRAHDQDD